MADTQEKKAQSWCFDGTSWRLIDDPMPDIPSDQTLYEWYLDAGFELLLGPGEEAPHHVAHISLWTRHSHDKPECTISIFHGADGGTCDFLYADRLPDGIDLFTRWAPAIHRHGSEPKPSK